MIERLYTLDSGDLPTAKRYTKIRRISGTPLGFRVTIFPNHKTNRNIPGYAIGTLKPFVQNSYQIKKRNRNFIDAEIFSGYGVRTLKPLSCKQSR